MNQRVGHGIGHSSRECMLWKLLSERNMWKKSEDFVQKLYVSKTEDPRRRGRPVVRWKDRVKEYSMKELLIEGEEMNKQGGSV